MEELSLDNILSEDEISSLFSDDETQEVDNKDTPDKEKDNKETEETTEVDPDDLFDGEPESVGSENTSEEDTDSAKGNTSSDFYSSIANALWLTIK